MKILEHPVDSFIDPRTKTVEHGSLLRKNSLSAVDTTQDKIVFSPKFDIITNSIKNCAVNLTKSRQISKIAD